MEKKIIRNVQLVNEGTISTTDVLIRGERIERIDPQINIPYAVDETDGSGKYLIPGMIDDQVHFREPGLTHKGTIRQESRAAVAGGVTTFMEMPNTIPPALTLDLLEDKYRIAARDAAANYSFYLGVSNNNADIVLQANKLKKEICGIKIFMGSSTGNLLVDNFNTLEKVFSESELLITTHCEDETIIRRNTERMFQSGKEPGPEDHPIIRDDEACYASSLRAVKMAQKYNTRLHILHITTEKELALFGNMAPLREKNITAEVCVHHLHFSSDDYAALGYKIKCNPAIKAPHNREALWKALLDDRIDVIATDHAPHLLSEKQPPYAQAHAGLPLVQHPLLILLHHVKQGRISLERLVEKTSHAVSDCYRIADRGYVREGYFADLVLIDLNTETTVTSSNLHYTCGWSPFEGFTFPASIEKTWVSGHLAYDRGQVVVTQPGRRLSFIR